MPAREDIQAIRITVRVAVRVAGEDGAFQKRGSHYDLMLQQGSVPDMSNEFIASLFAETARDTVMHELTGGNPSAGLTERGN